MKIYFNEIAVKQYLRKLAKNEDLDADSLFNDYLTIKSLISRLNDLLSILNIYEDSVLFVSHMLNIMNEIDMINENYLYKYSLKCSIFILEDLKLHHQQKKLRYHQLFKIESKSFERIYSLKKILEFYNETGKLNTQFVLFFMPMQLSGTDIESININSETVKGSNKRRKI